MGDSEGYSFLMPVLKALLEKSRSILSLDTNVPDLPPTSSGPVFFNDFQMFSGTKQWTLFIEKKVCLSCFYYFCVTYRINNCILNNRKIRKKSFTRHTTTYMYIVYCISIIKSNPKLK